jgi:hypothetical protein
MAKQTINVGITANDKKGDSLRAAFQKVNANFTELFNSSGFTGTTDRLINNDAELILSSTGTLTFPDGLTISDSVFEQRVESEGDAVGSKLVITDNEISIERYLDPDGLNNLERARVYANNSGVGMAYTSESVGGTVETTMGIDGASASISSTDGVVTNNWLFDVGGETILPGILQLPSNSYIRQRHSFTRTSIESAPAATATVIWSASQDWISSIKLTIQVEGNVTGDATGWHVQTCEATIASRGYADGTYGYGDPEMTVYGVVHTSAFPLATFEVQRNATTRLVEVVSTGADINNNIIVSIHSVEIGTTD